MSGIILAASATSAALIDVGILKSDVSACKTAFNPIGATCATVGADGDLFIGSSSGSVDKYDHKGTFIGTVYSGSEPAVALAMKDARTLVVAFSSSVYIVNTTNSTTVGTPLSATGTIKSISLSNDKELLSIATESSIHVHKLSVNAAVSLNLRAPPSTMGTTVFHPTRRSSLIACSGSQILTFDVTKPSAPPKVTSLGSQSRIVDITLLPGGKALFAAALDNREVLIVDLDKEKAIPKRIKLEQTPSAIAVSAGNTHILIGTVVGEILVYDVRVVDKPVCTIQIGTSDPIIALVPQKRGAATSTKVTLGAVATARAPPLGDNNAQITVSATRVVRKGATGTASTAKDTKIMAKTVATSTTVSPIKARKPVSRVTSARHGPESVATSPSAMRPVELAKHVVAGPTSPSVTRQVTRRVASANTVRRVSAGTSPLPSQASSPRSTVHPRKSDEKPSVLGHKVERPSSSVYSRLATERTPSPDLPIEGEVSVVYQGRYTEVPPINDAVEEADTTPGVIVAVAPDLSVPSKSKRSLSGERGHHRIEPMANNLPVYDSPVFLTPEARHGTSTPPRRKFGSNGKIFAPGALHVSPMRSPAPRLSVPTSTEAQEFLKNIVREAMFERVEEQREELRALHLDVVKMGRAWKNELRSIMQEYVGDLNAIRMENDRLRAENERLRRGY